MRLFGVKKKSLMSAGMVFIAAAMLLVIYGVCIRPAISLAAQSEKTVVNKDSIPSNQSSIFNRIFLQQKQQTEAKKEVSKEKITVKPPEGGKKKIAYLTFDDGPSKLTPQVLDVLDKYNVKASFFVIGELCKYKPQIVWEVKNRGHSICIHGYSHNYKKIFASAESFMEDVRKGEAELKKALGDDFTSKCVRIPGGGYGYKYKKFRTALKDNNYKYVYWDVETGDSEGHDVPVEKLLEKLKMELSDKYVQRKDTTIVLMHDAFDKQTTLEALPQVIELLKSMGYEFGVLE